MITSLLLAMQIWSGSGNVPVYPEGPRKFVDTAALPQPVNTIAVTDCANLQSALNTAASTDNVEVVITKTLICTGNYVVKRRTGVGWLWIRTSDLTQLPARGTRATSSIAGNVAKLITGTTSPALANDYDNATCSERRADRTWITGLEIAQSVNTYGLVRFDSIRDTPSGQPTDNSCNPQQFVLDRSYLHGTDSETSHTVRGLVLGADYAAVEDSTFLHIKDSDTGFGLESNCIFVGASQGPVKIKNNAFMCGCENLFFYPQIPGITPSDIMVTQNYIYKNTAWRDYVASVVNVKNLFECKGCARVILKDNVFRYSWAGGQSGFAIVLTARPIQLGANLAAKWATNEDILIKNNVGRDVGNFLSFFAMDNFCSEFNTTGDISGTAVSSLGQTFVDQWDDYAPRYVLVNNAGPYAITRTSPSSGTLDTNLGTLTGARILSVEGSTQGGFLSCKPLGRLWVENNLATMADANNSGGSGISMSSARNGRWPRDFTLVRNSLINQGVYTRPALYFNRDACGTQPGSRWTTMYNLFESTWAADCTGNPNDFISLTFDWNLFKRNALVGASGAVATSWTAADSTTVFPAVIADLGLSADKTEVTNGAYRSYGVGASLSCLDEAAIVAGTPPSTRCP